MALIQMRKEPKLKSGAIQVGTVFGGTGMLAIIVQVQNIGLLGYLPGLDHLRDFNTALVILPSLFTLPGGILVIAIVHQWRIVHVIVLKLFDELF